MLELCASLCPAVDRIWNLSYRRCGHALRGIAIAIIPLMIAAWQLQWKNYFSDCNFVNVILSLIKIKTKIPIYIWMHAMIIIIMIVMFISSYSFWFQLSGHERARSERTRLSSWLSLSLLLLACMRDYQLCTLRSKISIFCRAIGWALALLARSSAFDACVRHTHITFCLVTMISRANRECDMAFFRCHLSIPCVFTRSPGSWRWAHEWYNSFVYFGSQLAVVNAENNIVHFNLVLVFDAVLSFRTHSNEW